MAVKIPACRTSRCAGVPLGRFGGHFGRCERIVKRAANRPEKNITSEPSQIITPMASIGGRSWTILVGGARLSIGRA